TRFFVGLWDLMNFTRRLILNLLFFGLLLLLLLILASTRGSNVKPLLDRTTLVIAPEGKVVEQYSTDPVMRSLSRSLGDKRGEIQLRDLVRALDAAREDKRIERVLLRVDKLQPSGIATLREISVAL